jgi:hypothetical protein
MVGNNAPNVEAEPEPFDMDAAMSMVELLSDSDVSTKAGPRKVEDTQSSAPTAKFEIIEGGCPAVR